MIIFAYVFKKIFKKINNIYIYLNRIRMDISTTQKFNKKEYNKLYLEANKEKYYKMSRERNMERYYTDEDFRKQIIERAKISVKNKRMNSLKNLI